MLTAMAAFADRRVEHRSNQRLDRPAHVWLAVHRCSEQTTISPYAVRVVLPDDFVRRAELFQERRR
jgi:hypothetical protein